MATPRADSRLDNQLRQIATEHSLLSRADGSGRFSQGATSVLSSVLGPVEVKANKEILDKATVTVTFRPKIGVSAINEHVTESYLRQALEPIIVRSLHPRTLIAITVQIMQDDGSLLSCALNSACLALVDAGIPLNHMIASVACAWLPVEGAARPVLVLDPTYKEQQKASSVATFAFESHTMNVIMTITEGVMSVEEYVTALEAASKAAEKIFAFMRVSLERQLSKQFLL